MSARATVLVVDDTASNIHVIKHILDAEYRIQVATNGAKALAIVERGAPDLILLDVMMPDMDGYDVCRRLKANPATASIPVLFVSAHTDAQERAKGMALGALGYIAKPVEPRELLERVAGMLGAA